MFRRAFREVSTRQIPLEIREYGTLDGVAITDPYGTAHPAAEHDKRRRLEAIYAQDPRTARQLVQSRVAGMHGSMSGSLPGFSRLGALMSRHDLLADGETVLTGEHVAAQSIGQPWVSAADWKDPHTLRSYAKDSGPLTEEGLSADIAEIDGILAPYIAKGQYDPNALFVREKRLLEQRRDAIRQADDSNDHALLVANFPVLYGINTDGLPHDQTGWYDRSSPAGTVYRDAG
jgi:hypothetical protein